MPKTFLDKVIVLLRHYREAAGMSQSEIADRLKIGLRSYQRYESGESVPSIDLIYLLSKVLKFEMKDFFAPEESELDGFKIYTGTDRDNFLTLPEVKQSQILEFYQGPEYKKILQSGDIKQIRNSSFFMNCPLPLAISSTKASVLNPAALKLTGFNNDHVPTSTSVDDVKKLGLMWAKMMNFDEAYFEHTSETVFPRGKAINNSKGIFAKSENHYLTIAVFDVKYAESLAVN